MKAKLLRFIILWLLKRQWFFIAVCEALDLGGMHVHKNPVKKPKPTAIVNFPQPGALGTDE